MQAIIDLGTNTFHLLIAEIKNGVLCESYKMEIPVKIGKGGIHQGKLTAEAFERGMLALGQFSNTIFSFQINKVTAFATSAIRNAANGQEFIQMAFDRFGISISAISGEEEAKLIFLGVSKSFKLPDENVLVMDIGGGSVEFILAKNEQILFKQSFEIGAARLLEKFNPSNPISTEEIKLIEQYLAEMLDPLFNIIYENPVRKLVGSAGSFETLVDIILKDFQTIPVAKSKHAHSIPKNLFEIFHALIIGSTQEQRNKLRGLVDFRVDMIVMASVLMNYCVESFQIEEIIASNYSLKEGILFSDL